MEPASLESDQVTQIITAYQQNKATIFNILVVHAISRCDTVDSNLSIQKWRSIEDLTLPLNDCKKEKAKFHLRCYGKRKRKLLET